MTTKLLIGVPVSGKTETCLDRVIAMQSQPPLKQVWVLVPDRFQAAAFRRRLAEKGGVLGVQVGRFEDLYEHLLEQNGITKPVISMPLQNRLIRESIEQAVENGELTHFQPIKHFPGLVRVLRDVFVELKRSLISPSQFSAAAKDESTAHKEMGTVFQRYQERLEEIGCADDEEVHYQAVQLLKKNSIVVHNIELIVVDGFDQFTPVQHQALKLLSGQVQDMLITLPGSIDSQRVAHRRFTESMTQLLNDISLEVEEIQDIPLLPEIIRHLEQHLFEDNKAEPLPCELPILVEARSPADEVREALRWIKKLVIRENVPLSACAIFTPNPDIYHPLLRESAEEFGIPIHFTLDDPLMDTAMITALMNLLALPIDNFRTRNLMNVLRSPYFDFGITPEDADTLESISRMALIIEGRAQWEETWGKLNSSSGNQVTWLDDERNAPSLPRGDEVEKNEVLMEGVFNILTPPEIVASYGEWIEWTENRFDQLCFFDHIENEQERSAMQAFKEILQALVMSESVAGKAAVDYTSFIGELSSLLRAERYRETKSRGQPALLVGRITEARGVRYQAAVIMGLAEGSFPAIERTDPFLDEEIREILGLESRLEREQGGIFYQAITRADKHLLLTRSYLAEDGEDLEASIFWKAVASLVDKQSIQKVDSETKLSLCDAGSREELLFHSVRQKSLPKKYLFLEESWHQLQHARDVLTARRQKEGYSPYEGSLFALSPVMMEKFGPFHGWSASRLETYSMCPFFFYASQALQLAPIEQPEVGLNARQVGSLIHDLMEIIYKNAEDHTLDSLLTELRAQAKEFFSHAPDKFGFRASALWKIEQAQYLEILEKTITALEQDADWEPFKFEQKFGIFGESPLKIDLGDEIIIMRGVVDRIDKNAKGKLRIIDYKTGSSHLNKKDLEEGIRLQLPIYALAARDALELGEPVEGFYWYIQGAESGSLKLGRFGWQDKKGPEAAYAILVYHLQNILQGIRSARFHPEAPQGGCPSYCPAAQWCWKYESGGW